MPARNVPLKLIAAIGAGLLIIGLALFLHSLGSGGGFFAVSLLLIGAGFVVISIVVAIVRALKPDHQRPPE
jgi:hypothetical protein